MAIASNILRRYNFLVHPHRRLVVIAPQALNSSKRRKALRLEKSVARLLRNHDGSLIIHTVRRQMKDRKSRCGRGRPHFYSVFTLKAIWLYVRHGVEGTGLSVHDFCNREVLTWYAKSESGPVPHWTVAGPTLRRKYHEAELLLRQTRTIHCTPNGRSSPIEIHWRRQLKSLLRTGVWPEDLGLSEKHSKIFLYPLNPRAIDGRPLQLERRHVSTSQKSKTS